MRIVLITLFLTMSFPLTLRAQRQVDVTENKVPYRKQVPSAVRSKMPRGGQTRFFGVSKLEPKGELVAFHLYEVKGKNKDAPRTDNELPFSLPNCTLDVFRVSIK